MRTLLLVLPLCMLAGEALAAGSITCESENGSASVGLTIGSLPVLKVVGASVEAGGRRFALAWEGSDADGQAIVVGQAFREEGRVLVDFTDPNVESVTVSLRLNTVEEADHTIMAGTLAVTDVGAWAVHCVGP